jgi:uncharacterized protein involved in response to NO
MKESVPATFPVCKHRKRSSSAATAGILTWLASEPFRVFFFAGAVWSIIGVSLWPLFYAGALTYYPNFVHARIMIECFGGAFVVGFLGTAGPRMATAPKLTVWELLLLLLLHTAAGAAHLQQHTALGDACFLGVLVVLLLSLVIRVVRFRKELPPPQMLLALTGLLCGCAGTALWLDPATLNSPERYRLAGLLLYQGMLLPPVLGIGSFLFPRMLGGDFGEPTPSQVRGKFLRALGAAGLLVLSFFLEIWDHPLAAHLLRAGVAATYLLLEVNWCRPVGSPARGSLATGLFWALITGLAGIVAAGIYYQFHVGLDHLLYVSGFGLLILIVASRVLFGHSGQLDDFARKSWIARCLVLFAFLAATTRASADFLPTITISHHKYAAWTWGILALLWLIWHRHRFIQREK